MNPDFVDFLKTAKAKCDNCDSKDLFLFVDTRIKDCVAWACNNCHCFEIRVKPEMVKEFFKKQNDTKRIP